MIGKTISHYRILEKLGEGGMGVVYKAQDITLDRPVALKFLPKHLTSDSIEKERFIHEAKAASALNHTNITTIYEIAEFEGQMFMAMEYVEGVTLRQIVEKETLSIKKVLDIGIQLCEGLAMAHGKGIVHRDIKSDNVMLTPRGQVKMMDFGLAKLKGATKLTKTRSTIGTLAYMSPEQASGEEVDSRSDIFSFGVVLYELLTGRLPFQGEHQAAIVYSIVNEEPQPVARFNNNVSQELERIVFKALEKEKEERYQHIDDLLADLRRERKSLEYVKTGHIPLEAAARKPRKRLLGLALPLSVVFILVLLFFILRPFRLELAPEKKAIAQENSLAIMYFENLVDPVDSLRIGEIITELLITDLTESQYLKVVSSQRLYDILKLLGKEGVKRVDQAIATQVAQKAHARWMLLGRVLQMKPEMILTAQLVDVETGDAVASQRITGQPGENVFSLVDKLTVEIKRDLSLPAGAREEEERSVAEVTTHSQEAYRYYLEGLDYFNKIYYSEAERSFRKTLEFDSTFAMAYFRLAVMKHDEGDDREAKELIAEARKYSDKITRKEKLYIGSLEAYVSGDYPHAVKEFQKIVREYPEEKEAFLRLGDIYYQDLQEVDEAIGCFSQAVEIDPLYKIAYNALAYAYNEIEDLEKSIWAINKYISLAPDEANPYDSRGDLYAYNGRIDQAIESYKEALKIKPDFYMSLSKLGYMSLFKRAYASAESCFKELSSCEDKANRSWGRLCLALIPLYQGKFTKAMEVLNDGISADGMEQVEGFDKGYKHLLKAHIYDERQNLDLALNETQIAMEIFKKVSPDDPVRLRDYYAYLLARSGKLVEAEKVARALKSDIEQKNQAMMYAYWLALGAIELTKGNTKSAVDYFEKEETPNFQRRFLLAKTYLELGVLDKAVMLLEKALSRHDYVRACVPIRAVKAYYLLASAYDESGWSSKAIEKYEEFLDIWKDADPGIREIEDAKKRLEKLRVES